MKFLGFLPQARLLVRHIYLRECLSPSLLLDRPVSFVGALAVLSSELLSGRPPKNTLAFLFSLV